jgi:tetratricopeptide (TPR) repeat protein
MAAKKTTKTKAKTKTKRAADQDENLATLSRCAEEGRFEEAIAALKLADSKHPELADALGNVLAYATMADHRKLLDACLKRIQANPELLENPITVANVIGELVGKGRNEEAATISREHVKRMEDRGMTPVLYTNAILAFAAANDTGKEAAKLAKKIEQLLSTKGGAYFKKKPGQKKDLRGSAYAWLALYYARKNDVKAVVKNLEHSARVKYPDLTITELHPALAEMKRKPEVKAIFNRETDSAIAAKNKTIKKNPRDWWAIFSRGLIYHERNDLDLAEADYQRTIKLNPGYADVYNNMANLILSRGESTRDEEPGSGSKGRVTDLNEAIRWYSKAIDLRDDFLIALMNRGAARLEAGDAKHALTDVTRAMRIEPTRPAPHFFAAIASANLGDLNAAKKHAKNGVERDSTMDDIEIDAWKTKLKQLTS